MLSKKVNNLQNDACKTLSQSLMLTIVKVLLSNNIDYFIKHTLLSTNFLGYGTDTFKTARSVIKYCSVAYHSRINQSDSDKLERIQRTCLKVFLVRCILTMSLH